MALVPAVSTDSEIPDTFTFEGLKIGQKYIVQGKLMDNATGEPIKSERKEVTATVFITPNSTIGTAKIRFNFISTELAEKEIVVFEKLFLKENEIASHEDLNDEMQTVQFLDKPGDTTPRIPKLGYDDTPNVWLILSITASAFCAAICIHRRFKGRER